MSQLARKFFGPFLFMAMALAVGLSATTTSAQTPTCDGLTCTAPEHCGSKCVCNPYALLCLDNT